MASTNQFTAHHVAANQPSGKVLADRLVTSSRPHGLAAEHLLGSGATGDAGTKRKLGPGKAGESRLSVVEMGERSRRILQVAEQEFSKTGSWVVFYREMLGSQGVVRLEFPDPADCRAFQATPAYAELQEMVAALRSQESSKGDKSDPERMITIRLPKTLHDALTAESNELNLSINKLCISKLLQRIESRFVPVQQGRRRGRRPGPQGPKKKSADQH